MKGQRTGGQILPRRYGFLARTFLHQRNGKKVYVNRRVLTHDRREAEKVLREMAVSADKGTLRKPTRVTVSELAQRFMKDIVGQKEPKTQENYQHLIDGHIGPDLGHIHLQALVEDPTLIQTWLTRMLQKEAQRGNGKGNRKSLDRTLSRTAVREAGLLLGNMLAHGVRWRLIPVNPIQHVTLPTREQRKKRGLDAVQFERLLQATEEHEPRYFLPILLLGYSGMRPGEAARLTFGDLDLGNGRATVQKSKTEAGVREVDLLPRLVRALLAVQDQRDAKPTDLVLVQPDGRPMDQHNISQRTLPRLLKKAGLDRIRLYDLRHTYNVIAREAGVSVDVVQANMGHAKIATTMDVYGRVSASQRAEAMQRMDQYLSRIGNGKAVAR